MYVVPLRSDSSFSHLSNAIYIYIYCLVDLYILTYLQPNSIIPRIFFSSSVNASAIDIISTHLFEKYDFPPTQNTHPIRFIHSKAPWMTIGLHLFVPSIGASFDCQNTCACSPADSSPAMTVGHTAKKDPTFAISVLFHTSKPSSSASLKPAVAYPALMPTLP